ncbi:riboflavin biosynthesis protein RibT [Apilactobacillus sp. TMW 2.2459]|uniref:Riboflavin biosynthesis protein RibT n=1 Tax=Apilactobacillus xinyiensis TaxID=2841032 RepID=A0ABT0HZS2_9LACO|nr:riboflavin biosynthesis protein RibT [Apilactobacillus xinyiensis]MCK8624078.1 riboflavin biosynthesis protein RibT [Apilactobacillus xinyiensis]MCL0311670.1 riboflavin biosynthesis protein RibT [Apilactobacillus xinyiensis]MCL0318185.1 riboflavin biosynthesis protein RibT [Apilactobacillus xinyiensis]
MLFKYRNEYKKIAMDMLSLLPEVNDIDFVEEEIEWYSNSNSRNIYLWRNKENNWAGLISVEEKSKNIIVRRIILTPESWSINNCCIMIDALSHIYIDKKVIGTMDTTSICEIWEKRKNDEPAE